MKKRDASPLNSIVWKILAPTPIVVAISLVLFVILIPPMIERNVQEAARAAALEKVQQFRTVRGLYDRNVVDKVLEESGLMAETDHANNPKAIPAPATFIRDIGDALQEKGLTLKFYSPFPFMNRKDRKLDAFGLMAWDKLSADNDAVVIAEDYKNGHRTVRVAVGDKLVRNTCVACHNNHPLSDKTDWELGDLRGVFEVDVDVEQLLGTGERVRLIVVSTIFAIGLLIILVGIIIGRRMAGRLWVMREAVEAVADGDLDVKIPKSKSNDEIEALSTALRVFRDNAKQKRNLESEQLELTERISQKNRELIATNSAVERFVPRRFLELMEKDNITSVGLGDYVERDMTVLFSDIRNFTSLSEEMTPADNFRFINAYLNRMGPIIRAHNGFIDKYIGDAIMALFNSPDDALAASISMLEVLEKYNREEREKYGRKPIAIGIGLNTGSLMLGTIGESDRMDGTVISDAVNLAARIEGLTKEYRAPILISGNTFGCLGDTTGRGIRRLDCVTVKGKTEDVSLYEVFEMDEAVCRAGKLACKSDFETALDLMDTEDFDDAYALFQNCLAACPEDHTAARHAQTCKDEVIKRELLV